MAVPGKTNTFPDAGLRSANDFYILYLNNNNYILTQEVILKNVGHKVLRMRGWYLPEISFIQFKSKKLELQAKYDEQDYRLTFLINPDELQVSCSCGSMVEKLCFHAFKVLNRLLMYSTKTDFFRQFRPNGLVETAFAHKQYFTIKYTKADIDIEPKKELGCVYEVQTESKRIQIEDVLRLPSGGIATLNNQYAMCYMIMVPEKPYLIPFLLPVLGRLNKAGTEIRGFGKFLSGVNQQETHLLTQEQKTLNDLCLKMYKLVEKAPKLFKEDEETIEHDPQVLSEILSYWKIAFPLLNQQFVFTYPFWHTRYLKRQVFKKWTQRVSLSFQTPLAKVYVTESKSFYTVKLAISIGGKEIADLESVCTLFLQKKNTLYMHYSLRDAGVVEWFATVDNKLTVFKEHFPEFKSKFLDILGKHYTVEHKKNRSK